ncbi:EAL domain-containing protein [Alteromonas sp. ALT199]|uniref:bifunctional diguanylate cyclase/phosphodiesterase n=1 Tax=unclassified Alteromonas TaxID=2614992 RepID=UPI001BE80DD2|nr:EAL domain-containing protein [Alteromonas sp. ALT199]MBT3137186.1 EAL domain-containing protein [Alteromonas sp. ALT199]
MKSLRSQISFNTLASIAVVSALIIGLSIYVYEKLYIEFVSEEVDAISVNMAVDLINYIEEPAGSFNQTEILLRLDEYEYAEAAYIFSNDGMLLNLYVGHAGLKDGPSKLQGENSQHPNYADFDRSIAALPGGLHRTSNKVIMVKTVGEEVFPLGKLVLLFNLQDALEASRQRYITLVTPSVGILIIISLFISARAQRRTMRPLSTLIDTMNSVVDDKTYDAKVEEADKEEMLALSRAFNNMMASIKAQSEANRQKNEMLQKQQSQMEQLANFDALTGLPNRQFLIKLLSSELSKAQKNDRELGLLFIDLDGFKSVNDSFGHDTGDKFLLHISLLMEKTLSDDCILGRLGGDEFVVIVPALVSIANLEEIAKSIVNSVSKSHIVNGLRLDSSVSLGLALASDCNYAATNLITNADVAMYRAKEDGKARFVWFTNEMLAYTQRKVLISTRITNALENDAFYLTYQAKVDADESIIGFETLLRWHDEELGQVSPAEFIPIAEQTDKISHISLWVLKQLSHESPMLIKAFGSHVTISVNLSPHDLNNHNVTQFMLNELHTGRLPAQNLEIEVTESAYMNNFNIANPFFASLKKLGCKLALDDFGTGYSSLSYLTQFDIDTLKIDRSFVNKIGESSQSEMITKTIIEMAKSLEFSVCAEGVETQEQARFLTNHGCNMLQGFLYSKPLPLLALVENFSVQANHS